MSLFLLGILVCIMTTSTSFEIVSSLPKSSSVVYSLATLNRENVVNYNIVTYCSQMAVNPPSWAVSVYKNTKSHANLLANGGHGVAILQKLPRDFNTEAITLLGKSSGFDVNKIAQLDALGVLREEIEVEGIGHPVAVFSDALSLVVLKLDSSKPVLDLGDHDMVIMTPQQLFGGGSPGGRPPPCTTEFLREQGVI